MSGDRWLSSLYDLKSIIKWDKFYFLYIIIGLFDSVFVKMFRNAAAKHKKSKGDQKRFATNRI